MKTYLAFCATLIAFGGFTLGTLDVVCPGDECNLNPWYQLALGLAYLAGLLFKYWVILTPFVVIIWRLFFYKKSLA